MCVRFRPTCFFIAVLLFFQTVLFASSHSAVKQKLSIKDAAAKGLIDYRLSGTDGSHYGDCMGIVLQNNTDSDLVLHVEAGTQLVPADKAYQVMIVTKSDRFELPALGIKTSAIYAMCGEYYKEPPAMNSIYAVADMARETVVNMAKYIELSAKQNYKGQYAMWACTDQIGNEELEKYGATAMDINDVLVMAKEAKVPVKLSPVALPKDEKYKDSVVIETPTAQTIVLEDSLVISPEFNAPAEETALDKYGLPFLGGVVLLSGGLAYAIRRKRKKNSLKG